MGSWSVYCGISNIAITSGQKCVFLTLKKNASSSSELPYFAATLPIFGEYDDYGGIENIIKDTNTELIEKYFGITIDEYCKVFIDWLGFKRSETKEIVDKMRHFDEVKDWEYMWIDRQVYDYMSTLVNEPGHLNFGDKNILTMLGFNYIGENTSHESWLGAERMKYEWDFDGKRFFSDGDCLENGKTIIHYFNEAYGSINDSSLIYHINVPEDKKWIGEKSMTQLWEYLSERKAKDVLLRCIGYDHWSFQFDSMDRLIAEKYGVEPKPRIPTSMKEVYQYNYKLIGNLLCDLQIIIRNLYPMSGCLSPMKHYATPQCGEYEEHQKLFEKFAEINKSYIEEEDE